MGLTTYSTMCLTMCLTICFTMPHQVMMYSEGFLHAKALAAKVVAVRPRTSSNQLAPARTSRTLSRTPTPAPATTLAQTGALTPAPAPTLHRSSSSRGSCSRGSSTTTGGCARSRPCCAWGDSSSTSRRRPAASRTKWRSRCPSKPCHLTTLLTTYCRCSSRPYYLTTLLTTYLGQVPIKCSRCPSRAYLLPSSEVGAHQVLSEYLVVLYSYSTYCRCSSRPCASTPSPS